VSELIVRLAVRTLNRDVYCGRLSDLSGFREV